MLGLEIAVGCFFGLWLAASIANQFNFEAWKRIKSWDHFALIPKWTFFAPIPASTDFHLFYRDIGDIDDRGEIGDRGESVDGTAVGEWREVPMLGGSPFKGLWNPDKRQKKLFIDSVRQILQIVHEVEQEPHAIEVTLPYLLILNLVLGLPQEPTVRCRQFMVTESFGFFTGYEPRLILRSDAHRV
jgi:hypothetical protein